MVHAVARPLIELWMAGSPESWRQLPRPADTSTVHSHGVNPDRILLAGGGFALGYGVVSHDLALGGHLARQLSGLTNRGADVDIRVRNRASLSTVTSYLARLDLTRFDAVLVVVGVLEALELATEQKFRQDFQTLIRLLDRETPRVFILGIGPVRSLGRLPATYVKAVDKRVRAFNEIMSEECAKTSVGFIMVPGRSVEPGNEVGSGRYLELSTMIAPYMACALGEGANSQRRADTGRSVERARVNALLKLGLLNTEAEPEFDEVVKTARNLFGTDVAALNFVDSDRLWVKAFSGTHPGNLSRSEAPCALTVQGPELLVIEDLTIDQRFSGQSWVGGENGARFYAGYPIESPEGMRIGTLCIVDSQPRVFTTSDHALLRQLALRLQALVNEASKRESNRR